jgi:hypothetical protein
MPVLEDLAAITVPAALQAAACELLETESFTAGEHVVFSRIVGDESTASGSQLKAIAKSDIYADGTIFLVDHTWSFTSAEGALSVIKSAPALHQRICGIVAGVDEELSPEQALCRLVPLLRTQQHGPQTVFVMMDEVGVRIERTCDSPEEANCKMASLAYTLPSGETIDFSLVWAFKDIEEGEALVVAREGPAAAEERQHLLRLGAQAGALATAAAASVGADAPPAPTAGHEGGAAAAAAGAGTRIPVRVGVCESYTQAHEHSSLMYQPMKHTRRKLAATGRYDTEYVVLTGADFPSGAADDVAVASAAAAAISSRCDVVLGYSLGEMVAWDMISGGRCKRVDDILAVYKAVDNTEAAEAAKGAGASGSGGGGDAEGTIAIPCYAFQRFCFFKTQYMHHLRARGVPTGPTLLVTQADLRARRAAGGAGGDADGASDGVAGLAADLADQVRALRGTHWEAEQPYKYVPPGASAIGAPEGGGAAETEAGAGSAAGRMKIDPDHLFLKADSGWCREGNLTVGPLSAPGAFDELVQGQLEEALRKLLVGDGANGVQIQPALTALAGQSVEFRGLHVRGELVWVCATYFRCAGGASYNLTDIASEVMIIDHGVPKDDKVVSGVPFQRIRQVMEEARAGVADLIGHMPIAIRTDCAVDLETGQVVLNEIEGGLDFSVFPLQVTSYNATDGITTAVVREFEERVQARFPLRC